MWKYKEDDIIQTTFFYENSGTVRSKYVRAKIQELLTDEQSRDYYGVVFIDNGMKHKWIKRNLLEELSTHFDPGYGPPRS